MTTITIDGREITLPIYKLGLMRKAAPFIDNVMAAAKILGAAGSNSAEPFAAGSLSGLFELLGDVVAVIAVGAVKVDPTYTADYLRDQFTFADMPMLQTVFASILRDAGVGAVEIALSRKGVSDAHQLDAEDPSPASVHEIVAPDLQAPVAA